MSLVSLVKFLIISDRPEVETLFKKAFRDVFHVSVFKNVKTFNICIPQIIEKDQNLVVIVDTQNVTEQEVLDIFLSEKYISMERVFFVESDKLNDDYQKKLKDFKTNLISFPCDSTCIISAFEKFIFSTTPILKENKFEKLPFALNGFVGSSSKVLSLKRTAYEIAKTDIPIILEGESGTGKTLLAKLIHKVSERNRKTFKRINMSCLNENIAETELFGSVTGAFTDAVSKNGILCEADGGTVFFDEIAELPLSIQAKLLMFLDSGCFYKVGSTKECHSDVRVISATNKNLEELVEKGEFRRDLYERLKGKVVTLPSLNSRPEDIKEIVSNFLLEHGFSSIAFTEEAYELLKIKNWKGNVRELEHCLYLTCAINGKDKQILGPEDLIFA